MCPGVLSVRKTGMLRQAWGRDAGQHQDGCSLRTGSGSRPGFGVPPTDVIPTSKSKGDEMDTLLRRFLAVLGSSESGRDRHRVAARPTLQCDPLERRQLLSLGAGVFGRVARPAWACT